jgi:hypothetical protein
LLSALAIIGITAVALFLVVLPAVIGLRLLELRVDWAGAALTLLGALLGGVKLMAMAWAVGGRFFTAPSARAIAAAD